MLIGRLVELIEYRDYLTKTQPDADSRWDNVEELMNFAAECDASVRTSERPALSVKKSDDPEDLYKTVLPLLLLCRQSVVRSFISTSG